jgi:hypothetical protein
MARRDATVVDDDGRRKAYRPLVAAARLLALEAGLAAYERGDFFLAHELLEPAWMGTRDPVERDLHQGLIKLAAAGVHAVRGNSTGVRKNLAGAHRRLAQVVAADTRANAAGTGTGQAAAGGPGHRPVPGARAIAMGHVDVAGLLGWVETALSELDRVDEDVVAPAAARGAMADETPAPWAASGGPRAGRLPAIVARMAAEPAPVRPLDDRAVPSRRGRRPPDPGPARGSARR